MVNANRRKKVLSRPIIRKRRPNEENEFLSVHSVVSGTEHIIRKSEIARWCPSTAHAPGTHLFFVHTDHMNVIEDFNSITECMLELP